VGRVELVRRLHYRGTKSLKHCSLLHLHPTKFPSLHRPTHLTSVVAGGCLSAILCQLRHLGNATEAQPFASKTSTFWNGVEKGRRWCSAASDVGARKSGRAWNSAWQLRKKKKEEELLEEHKRLGERLGVSIQHVRIAMRTRFEDVGEIKIMF